MLEEAGHRRNEIRHLSRWYVLRVLQHPRTEKGALDADLVQPAPVDDLTPEMVHRRRLQARNYPEHLIDLAAQEAVALRRRLAQGGGVVLG